MKFTFLVLLLGFVLESSFAVAAPFTRPEEVVGIYKLEFLASADQKDNYYVAEVEFYPNGELFYRDEEVRGLVMPMPACSGTFHVDGYRIVNWMNCSSVSGPKSIWQIWEFQNLNDSMDDSTILLYSSLIPNQWYQFRITRLESPMWSRD